MSRTPKLLDFFQGSTFGLRDDVVGENPSCNRECRVKPESSSRANFLHEGEERQCDDEIRNPVESCGETFCRAADFQGVNFRD